MIKISPKNIEQIQVKHLNNCKPIILKKLKFYKDFTRKFMYNAPIQFNGKIISKHYDLNANTLKVLIKPFYNKESERNKPSSVNIKDLENTLKNQNNILINTNFNYEDIHNIIEEVERDIDSILIGKPDVLNRIKKKTTYSPLIVEHKYVIEKLFDYDTFSSDGFKNQNGELWGTYDLTRSLEINTCPYCNRNWINTVGVQDGKITNPQLDHYFNQADFPILRLSLYNLIPSCETCNARLKKKKDFIYHKNLHPYDEGYGSIAKFKTIALDYESGVGKSNNYNVQLEFSDFISDNLRDRIDTNHNLFKINEIYKHHGDIISELFLKKQLYSLDYLSMLQKNIQFDNHIDIAQLYRIAFANYLDEKDFSKRPFAKLILNLAEQLELIKIQ